MVAHTNTQRTSTEIKTGALAKERNLVKHVILSEIEIRLELFLIEC